MLFHVIFFIVFLIDLRSFFTIDGTLSGLISVASISNKLLFNNCVNKTSVISIIDIGWVFCLNNACIDRTHPQHTYILKRVVENRRSWVFLFFNFKFPWRCLLWKSMTLSSRSSGTVLSWLSYFVASPSSICWVLYTYEKQLPTSSRSMIRPLEWKTALVWRQL